MTKLWLAIYLFSLLPLPIVFFRRYEPAATIAWILAMVFLPILGALFFLFFGIRFAGRGTHVVRERNEQIRHFAREFQNAHMRPHVETIAGEVHGSPLYQLCRRLGDFEPCGGNEVIYSVDAHKTYQMMEEVILEARHHINLEYYIFMPDALGLHFIDLLMAKALQGVRVNFLYDPLGSWALHSNRPLRERMRRAGIHVQPFIITRLLFRPWYLNMRNHRKILVVDGRKGFLGGLNVGSMFLAPPGKHELWRDAQIFLHGPAVASLQWIFVEDWHFSTGGETLLDECYFPTPETCGNLPVQVLASGPVDECETAEMVLFNAITTARRKVFLCTPYFIPDSAIMFALQSAAMRGLDVRLMLPKRTDHFSCYLAGRSYYDDLLGCGVKIYEYIPGVLHSKELIVDENMTIISSVNVDIRSFRYNFEVSAQIWGEEFAATVLREFRENLKRSECIDLERFRQRGLLMQAAEHGCRLLSPLL